MSKNSYVNLESLEKICLELDCRIEDVIEISKSKQLQED
ncbi:helix-turn-helix domain-containing protein [Anaerococcus porci]|nr:helix-turn-helix domain-containing protein [Anaerococcus porci]MDY3006249.1 helix-turn-helix domain-containing protein [Anaerococcus porci]